MLRWPSRDVLLTLPWHQHKSHQQQRLFRATHGDKRSAEDQPCRCLLGLSNLPRPRSRALLVLQVPWGQGLVRSTSPVCSQWSLLVPCAGSDHASQNGGPRSLPPPPHPAPGAWEGQPGSGAKGFLGGRQENQTEVGQIRLQSRYGNGKGVGGPTQWGRAR